jgi:hypothetical protein
MASNTLTFGKPVLYLNGDSHVYRSDDPLQQGSACAGLLTARCEQEDPSSRAASVGTGTERRIVPSAPRMRVSSGPLTTMRPWSTSSGV